jgi:hypothetical protein
LILLFIKIKRMKQLEQEKDSLLKGLDMVEQAREWYHRQVVGVEDKQKYIGHTSYHVSRDREGEIEAEERVVPPTSDVGGEQTKIHWHVSREEEIGTTGRYIRHTSYHVSRQAKERERVVPPTGGGGREQTN